MAFPTPSDLLWVTGFPVQGRWLTAVLRDAVRAEWPDAVDFAISQLGDESSARELMELAIEGTHELLVDRDHASLDDVRQVLRRCYRNAVRRAYRQQTRLSLWGSSRNLDHIAEPFFGNVQQVEARIDLEAILKDTPDDIRLALLMRYGTRSSWEEVAHATSSSVDTIRMRCKRELLRLGRRAGLRRLAL